VGFGDVGRVTRDGGRFLHHPPQPESVSVMETSFSSSANHTFAEGELKQVARTPTACD
jgi:hypothetical protein